MATVTTNGTVVEEPTRPDYSAIRNQYVNLIGTINAAYNQLLTAGRDNDAFALRDAIQRMSQAAGGTAWSRLQAANDLRARMAAAARVLQGTTTAQALSAQGAVLNQISSLDQATFNDMIKGGQFDLQKQQQSFNQSQAEIDAELKKKQEERAAEAWDMQKKAATAAQEASKSNVSGWNAPVATPKTQQTLATAQPSNFTSQSAQDAYERMRKSWDIDNQNQYLNQRYRSWNIV